MVLLRSITDLNLGSPLLWCVDFDEDSGPDSLTIKVFCFLQDAGFSFLTPGGLRRSARSPLGGRRPGPTSRLRRGCKPAAAPHPTRQGVSEAGLFAMGSATTVGGLRSKRPS